MCEARALLGPGNAAEGSEVEFVGGESPDRIGVTRHEIEAKILGHIRAELGRIAPIIVVVIVAAASWRQQFERRHRDAAGMKVSDIEGVVEGLVRSAETRGLI